MLSPRGAPLAFDMQTSTTDLARRSQGKKRQAKLGTVNKGLARKPSRSSIQVHICSDKAHAQWKLVCGIFSAPAYVLQLIAYCTTWVVIGLFALLEYVKILCNLSFS